MPKRNDESVIFSVVFKKGQADKNRLPLGLLLSTLRQIEYLVQEVGRQVQREAGVQKPDGDFGIELVAGRNSLAFRRGSVGTQYILTHDVQHGIQTIGSIIDTTAKLTKRRANFMGQYDEQILRRLPRLSELQQKAKTEVHFALKQAGQTVRAALDRKAQAMLAKLEGPELEVEAITLYGKLRELTDRSMKSDSQEGHFWGELIEDNGNKWRIRFEESGLGRALKLFRKQVKVEGDATYYQTAAPRLVVKDICEDRMPNYLSALKELRKENASFFKNTTGAEVLKNIRE